MSNIISVHFAKNPIAGVGTCGLVAMTSASHAEGGWFDPGQVYACCKNFHVYDSKAFQHADVKYISVESHCNQIQRVLSAWKICPYVIFMLNLCTRRSVHTAPAGDFGLVVKAAGFDPTGGRRPREFYHTTFLGISLNE